MTSFLTSAPKESAVPVNTQTFVSDFNQFFNDSIDWCKAESEKESTAILNSIKHVMDDVSRRSKMSEAAESAFLEAESRLSEMVSSEKKVSAKEILKELSQLKSDSTEVNKLMNPVVEALQFQDRLTQSLDGIALIISEWFNYSQTHGDGPVNAEQETQFATELVKKLRNPEERKIVRKYFDLGDEEQTINSSVDYLS